MSSPLPKRFALLALTFWVGGVSLSAQIIQNGSFENDYTGWTASGHQGIAVNDPQRPPTDGSRVVVFNPNDQNSNAVLSQTFATTPGQRYELVFDFGVVGSISDERLEVQLQGNGVLLDQVVEIAGLDPATPTTPFYVPQHIFFTANSANTSLTFLDASYTYVAIDCFIDNVRVNPLNALLPAFTTQPHRTAVAQGTNATFAVTASGPGTLTYQWQFNGINIPGANGTSYTVPSADFNNAGNYSVVVTNSSGSITSSAATLTVLPPGILLNGSFEYGSAAWTYTGVSTSTSTNGATYGVTDGVNLTHFNWGQGTPGGSVSQTFNTVPGQGYALQFDYGAFSFQSTDLQQMQVTAQGNSTLLSQSVSVNGIGTGHTYKPASFVFVADSTTTTLTFHDTSPTTINIDLLLDNVRVAVQGAPLITSQPKDAAAQIGKPASFSVTAAGQAPLSYQWRLNGQNIPGANSATYTINSVQNADAGTYDVVVSNAINTATSTTATLSIIPPGTPVNGGFEYDFAAWTVSGAADIVTSAQYPVTEGSKAVVFNAGQRTASGVLSQSFSTTAGTTYVLSFSLGVFSWQSTNQQQMKVTAQGNSVVLSQAISLFGQGTGTFYQSQSFMFVADSTTTTVTFQDTSPSTTNIDLLLDNVRIVSQNAPSITTQPQNAAAQIGGSATFTVSATGQAPLSYQWRFNGTNIPGANSTSYTINSVQNSNAGGYDVVVSNAADSATSTTATLTIVPPGTPANGGFEYDYTGWTATGNQGIVSPPGFPTTEGSKAVVFNAGQTTPNGVLSQTFATTAGTTYVLNFDLGVSSWQTTAQQRMQVTVQGNTTLLSQSLSLFGPGTGSSYQAESFVFVADSSNTTLTFQDTSPATTNIDLLLDNVRVTTQSAPTITGQPQSATVQAGSNVTFTVTAGGQQPLSYQWRYNTQNIPGANSSSYSITGVQNADGGSYDVVVSNAINSVTSSPATLTILPPGTPSNGSFEYGYAAWNVTGNQVIVTTAEYPVTNGSKAVAFNAGQQTCNGTLSQTIPTTAGKTYMLTFDMGVFSYQSSAEQRMQVTVQGTNQLLTQSISMFGQGTGTHYQAQSFTFVADSANTTLTFQDTSPTTTNIDLLLDNVNVAVQGGPTITGQPHDAAAQVGNSASFSVTASGQAPLSYQWRFNGQNISGANSSSYTINSVQNGNAGSYDVVVSNAINSATSAAANLSIVPPGTPANGSFEFDYAGWTATGNQGIVSSADYPVSNGSKALEFNAGQQTPNGVLSQSFSTTPGTHYLLTFDLGVASYQSTAQMRAQVTVQGNTTLLSQSVSVFGPGTGSFYQPQSFMFVADSTTTTLTFQDTSTATINIDLLLDNVQVAPQ